MSCGCGRQWREWAHCVNSLWQGGSGESGPTVCDLGHMQVLLEDVAEQIVGACVWSNAAESVTLVRPSSDATASRWDLRRPVSSPECGGQPQAFGRSLTSPWWPDRAPASGRVEQVDMAPNAWRGVASIANAAGCVAAVTAASNRCLLVGGGEGSC